MHSFSIQFLNSEEKRDVYGNILNVENVRVCACDVYKIVHHEIVASFYYWHEKKAVIIVNVAIKKEKESHMASTVAQLNLRSAFYVFHLNSNMLSGLA